MADPTYVEVGATRGPQLPLGYHHVIGERVVGRGAGDFERAAEAVMRWDDVQRGPVFGSLPDRSEPSRART